MDVPVIDLRPLFDTDEYRRLNTATELARAFTDVGFVFVINHEVGAELLASMRTLLVQIFAADEDTKNRWLIDRDNYRGYIPLGFFTPNRADTTTPPDSYEGFKLHWECPTDHPVRAECSLYGPNRWPDHVPGMAKLVLDYWDQCERLADTLLAALAETVGIEPAVILTHFDAPLTNMTLLHYPPKPFQTELVGIHPHKDISALTILHPDPSGGLDLQTRTGEWVEAVGPPEALLVNAGDLLELWSGGRFVSTPHRVVNRTNGDRYSAPYFAVPNHRTVVEPLIEKVPGFERDPVPVGQVSAEVWRTNWPDENPSTADFHLGTLSE
ncbi:MAG: 2-oxoglutarate and iron-dependent oxygenase domain-containing protein [Actinomycetota bacterium]|nr:2-oxoglutarate and iron-dependent oxygenase domain-containing protein [Actinomycetota bacterium]